MIKEDAVLERGLLGWGGAGLAPTTLIFMQVILVRHQY